jgi:hypothetical protein
MAKESGFSNIIFRNSIKPSEKPITLIPFHNLPKKQPYGPTGPTGTIGPTGLIDTGELVNVESSSGNDSGNSNSSILISSDNTIKKNPIQKKKVTHEGYANTSDSEAGGAENVVFTINAQRDYQWSDSEELSKPDVTNVTAIVEMDSTISSQTTSHDSNDSIASV